MPYLRIACLPHYHHLDFGVTSGDACGTFRATTHQALWKVPRDAQVPEHDQFANWIIHHPIHLRELWSCIACRCQTTVMCMKPRVRCAFLFGKRQLSGYSDCLDAFRGGFWIDDELKYSNGTSERYWIPPHEILYIAIE